MNRKIMIIFLALALIILISFLIECYVPKSIEGLQQKFENKEWKSDNEIKRVLIVGSVKTTQSFPVRRFLLSSKGGNIWVVIKKNEDFPSNGSKVIVFGNVKRFYGVFAIYIEEVFHFSLAMALILLFIVIVFMLVVVLFVLRTKNYTYIRY